MKRYGKAFIKMDGNALESLPGASFEMGGVNRNTVIGGNKVLGYSEEPVPAKVECQISLAKGIKLEEFRQATDVVVTFATDTGQTYQLKNAWLAEPPKSTQGEGGPVDLIFNAEKAEELT